MLVVFLFSKFKNQKKAFILKTKYRYKIQIQNTDTDTDTKNKVKNKVKKHQQKTTNNKHKLFIINYL